MLYHYSVARAASQGTGRCCYAFCAQDGTGVALVPAAGNHGNAPPIDLLDARDGSLVRDIPYMAVEEIANQRRNEIEAEDLWLEPA